MGNDFEHPREREDLSYLERSWPKAGACRNTGWWHTPAIDPELVTADNGWLFNSGHGIPLQSRSLDNLYVPARFKIHARQTGSDQLITKAFTHSHVDRSGTELRWAAAATE